MKQMAVSKIPCGETFSVFGDTFVALDRVDGGVLAIRRDIWKNAAFDKDGRNDMRGASIRNDLSDYLIELFGNGANYESIIKMDVDLIKVCSCIRCIRPAPIFASTLLVEYGGGVEERPNLDAERAIYDWYLRYVFDWANFNSENVGESPLSYDEWKRKHENRPA